MVEPGKRPCCSAVIRDDCNAIEMVQGYITTAVDVPHLGSFEVRFVTNRAAIQHEYEWYESSSGPDATDLDFHRAPPGRA